MSKAGRPSQQKLDEMLRGAQLIQQQQPKTRRTEQIVFQGCSMELNYVTGEDGETIIGYQIQIHDPTEEKMKIYIFNFDGAVMGDLNTWANAAPNIGEKFSRDAA